MDFFEKPSTKKCLQKKDRRSIMRRSFINSENIIRL